ncbi:MAG: hypothetical protein IPN74_16830 [Haliscomenobacter sp.]|nr:hypothetical protein [Haliscomenobacter sp.]
MDEIKAVIVGKKRIGRSRSAEYGLVEIKFERELPIESKIIPVTELTLIYALSNLCFYDSFGRPTVTPTSAQLGVPGGKILWKKSQIRSRFYQTWNRHRHNRDADRMIIEKGSVIAIQHGQPLDTKIFAGGIGSHKAEGFGQVMINPSFLLSTGIKLSLVLTKVKKQIEALAPAEVGVPSAQDTFLLNYLEQQKTQKSGIFSLSERVNEFVSKHGRDFQGISPSQWERIQAVCEHAANWDVLKISI